MKKKGNNLKIYIDELELSEKVKKGIKILTWIVPIVIFSFVIYIAFIESDQKKLEREIKSTMNYTFKGIVKRKYISWNHQTPTTVLKSGKEIGSDYGLYNLVRLNDSISKEKGVLYMKIYRKESESGKYFFLDKEYFNIIGRKDKNESSLCTTTGIIHCCIQVKRIIKL